MTTRATTTRTFITTRLLFSSFLMTSPRIVISLVSRRCRFMKACVYTFSEKLSLCHAVQGIGENKHVIVSSAPPKLSEEPFVSRHSSLVMDSLSPVPDEEDDSVFLTLFSLLVDLSFVPPRRQGLLDSSSPQIVDSFVPNAPKALQVCNEESRRLGLELNPCLHSPPLLSTILSLVVRRDRKRGSIENEQPSVLYNLYCMLNLSCFVAFQTQS